MSSIKILFLLLLVTFWVGAPGQNSPAYILDSISGKLISDIRAHDNERAYLVTDKSVFIAGESIWFKAFLLKSMSQKISSKSKFLFVDLVDEKDSVIKIVIMDAFNRELNSRIVLNNSIETGNYWLRAYTRQMAESGTNNLSLIHI